MKKLVNDPNAAAAEALEGLALAYPQYLRKIEGLTAVVRKDAPVRGKVAVLTGGGSGHEPMFAGFVGPGWADASVAGNIFTSPPPPPIYETAKAVDGGAGVLFLYGNYAGDVLNFDMAAEMLTEEGIQVSTVRVADDVASAPSEKRNERRGIAGDFFVIKVASARAEERAALAEVTAAAQKANDRTRSMGVALTSCVIPVSGRPIFEISDQEMEIGMGLHGEPGVVRGPMTTANRVAQDMIGRILGDLPAKQGDEVAILVNGLGATPLSELFIMFRATRQLLEDAGLLVWRAYVGNFASSLDMAGCSLTLLQLDSELKRLLSAPAASPAFVQEG
ncbi:MAG TPA: dihydroxyacetone kinase subunit DhaK [Terriglobia bacterium]|nr:dihydroxyacetone kinase subunit DhaK [Terriglobia bacterium]